MPEQVTVEDVVTFIVSFDHADNNKLILLESAQIEQFDPETILYRLDNGQTFSLRVFVDDADSTKEQQTT